MSRLAKPRALCLAVVASRQKATVRMSERGCFPSGVDTISADGKATLWVPLEALPQTSGTPAPTP